MVAFLSEKYDRALTQRWAIWLTKQDPESGLEVRHIIIDSGTENQSNQNL